MVIVMMMTTMMKIDLIITLKQCRVKKLRCNAAFK